MSDPKSDDFKTRVRRAQQGDIESTTWLITQSKDRLLRFLLLLTGDAVLSQDLSQETYLDMIEKITQLKDPEAFFCWLLLIARNRFFDFKKRHKNRPYVALESLGPLGVFTSPHDLELWLSVTRALGSLSDKDREVLLLIDLEGYSYQEAASQLGVSESAITSTIYRARQAFHTLYYKA